MNEHGFSDVVQAKIINECRYDYNECKPFSILNYQTPSEFTTRCYSQGYSGIGMC